MTLTPAQAEIARCRARFKVICIGRRGGKTTHAIEEIKGKIAANKRHIAYIAPTYQQARDIAWEMMKRELVGVIVSTNESRLEITVKTRDDGTCLIVLRGWESIETLRGQAFDLIIIDEVAMMREFWANWQEVIRPTLTDTKGNVIFISTPKGFNHFYDLYNLEAKDSDFRSFHFTSYDNPHIPKEEIDKAREELTPDRFAQEYLADFRKTEGLVYKEFERERNCYDKLPEAEYESIAGIDFGFTNPAAVLHIKYRNEHFWVDDEWYKRGRTERQIAEYVKACNFQAVYPDPESPSAIEELRNLNVNIREVVKGKDSVQSGIQRVREILLSGRLHINKRCLNLIHEFESYTYDDESADRNAPERPIKANDHALDALRYVVRMKRESETKSNYRQPEYEPDEFEGGKPVMPGQGWGASGMTADRTGGKVDFGFNRVVNKQPEYERGPNE